MSWLNTNYILRAGVLVRASPASRSDVCYLQEGYNHQQLQG